MSTTPTPLPTDPNAISTMVNPPAAQPQPQPTPAAPANQPAAATQPTSQPQPTPHTARRKSHA